MSDRCVDWNLPVFFFLSLRNRLHFFLSGQPLHSKEMLGWATLTLLSRSSPETLWMVLLCNMGILWALSTLTGAECGGFTTTVLTTTPEIAAQPTSIRAHIKTLTQASRSSRSCEAPASTSKHEEKLVEDFTYNISKAFMSLNKSKLKYSTVPICPIPFSLSTRCQTVKLHKIGKIPNRGISKSTGGWGGSGGVVRTGSG